MINALTILAFGEGQITPFVLGGLALTWTSVHQKQPYLAGVGGLLLVTKYHYGGILALYLWLHPDLTWKQRFQILIIPIIVVLASFALYGFCPLELIDILQKNSPDDAFSIALWQWIGPFSLILWLPVFLLKLPYIKRFQLIVITCTLALPYFQYHDLNVIYLYTNYLALSSWLIFVSLILTGTRSFIVLIPLTIYALMVDGEIRKYFQPEPDTQSC